MAEYAEERRRVCQEIRLMSKALPNHPSARNDPQPDLQPMAFCIKGARYFGPLPQSYKKLEICDSGDRLFHQVGGGRSFGKHP